MPLANNSEFQKLKITLACADTGKPRTFGVNFSWGDSSEMLRYLRLPIGASFVRSIIQKRHWKVNYQLWGLPGEFLANNWISPPSRSCPLAAQAYFESRQRLFITRWLVDQTWHPAFHDTTLEVPCKCREMSGKACGQPARRHTKPFPSLGAFNARTLP